MCDKAALLRQWKSRRDRIGYRVNHAFTFEPNSRCIVVTWTGAITLESLITFYREFVALAEYPERRSALHDLRGAEVEVEFAGLEDVKVYYSEIVQKGDGTPRLAFVVASPYQFGQLRQATTKVGLISDMLISYSVADAKAFAGLPEDYMLPADR